MCSHSIRTVQAERYVTPLRQGGSLPAVIEADDGRQYVMKFAGAGQGRKALIAELLSGEIGRALGLTVPEIVLIRMDRHFGRSEPDPEIQDLLRGSVGLNLGLAYLPSAVEYSPLLKFPLTRQDAARIVWFDALVSNVDRTPRNTNMLMWHRAPWLIDHGSTLYFHHTEGWERDLSRARSAFRGIKDHVLLRHATTLEDEDEGMARVLTEDVIEEIVRLVPEAWLADGANTSAAADVRAAYRRYLVDRLAPPRGFVEEAARAR